MFMFRVQFSCPDDADASTSACLPFLDVHREAGSVLGYTARAAKLAVQKIYGDMAHWELVRLEANRGIGRVSKGGAAPVTLAFSVAPC